VADFYRLSWDQVKAIDKAYLEAKLGPIDLEGVDVIIMDEFALHKGHRYATVIAEPSTKRVLWVGRGRSREEIRPFFELLGEQGCQRLKAVGMDMNTAYELEVRKHCPQAAIVYDLFHIVAKYGREVIDRVRVDEANRLRKDRKARQVVKSARWLLLRNRSNLKRPEDRVLTNSRPCRLDPRPAGERSGEVMIEFGPHGRLTIGPKVATLLRPAFPFPLPSGYLHRKRFESWAPVLPEL
jgi:transposase